MFYSRRFISVCKLKSINKIIGKPLDFIGYSNLFLAVVVFSSTLQNGFLFPDLAASSVSFAILNFLSAFFLYNLQRIYQSAYPTNDERLLWYRKNKKWIFTIAILFILVFYKTIWVIFNAYKQGVFVYCFTAFLSLLYFLPPLSLRKLKFSKQFFIAFCWTVVCGFIPALFQNNQYSGVEGINSDKWLYLISQFFFISALCIPFDIRDYKKDLSEGTNSLPVLIGVNNSKIAAYLFVLIYWSVTLFMNESALIIPKSLIAFASLLVIYYAKENNKRYYFIFLTDGIILLQSVLLYFL